MNDATLDRRIHDGLATILGDHSATPDWAAVLTRAHTSSATTRRPRRSRGARRRLAIIGMAALAAVCTAATIPQIDWISSQFARFDASGAANFIGAKVVAKLRQHDGTTLLIAEKTTGGTRCYAMRPAAQADPVSAPRDPLAFSGLAACTATSTMSVESTWLENGSGALIARRPDDATRLELRQGTRAWSPASEDGQWVAFWLAPGALQAGIPIQIFALDNDGQTIDSQTLGSP